MSFTSQDDLISEVTNGKSIRTDWNKSTTAGITYTAGRWYDFSLLAGTPVANTYAGTALNFTPCNASSGFNIYTGGNVTPDTKHLMNLSGLTSSATGPGTIMFVDMIGYYPGINMNISTTQTFSVTPSAAQLRYSSGNGIGAFLVPYSATTGATAHNVTITYVDQSGNTGNVTPGTVACTASAVIGHITHSGTAANNFGPFLPYASGDFGIQRVTDIKLSAVPGSASNGALVLARPITTLPITTVNVLSERDLLNQLPSLPRIYDDACITMLYFPAGATAASSVFSGHIELAYG